MLLAFFPVFRVFFAAMHPLEMYSNGLDVELSPKKVVAADRTMCGALRGIRTVEGHVAAG